MYSVPMAIVDFVPVVFFGAAALLLQKDLYNKMSKGAFAMFCAGTINVFMAGALKALYKLLHALTICDFQPLNNIFFPLQALGFLLAGIAMVCLLTRPQGREKTYAVGAPVLFTGTWIFVTLMVAGMLGMTGSLAVIAGKMKRKAVIFCFVLAFFFSLCMGYLSSRDFAQGYMNWIAEGVNILGQGMLFAGVYALHKAGLGELTFQKAV